MVNDFELLFSFFIKNQNVINTNRLKELSKVNRLEESYLYQASRSPRKNHKYITQDYKYRETELLSLLQTLNNKSINYILIKGISYKKYLPKHYHRSTNDYDLIIKNISEFWKLQDIFYQEGYTNQTNLRLIKDKEIFGSMIFMKNINSVSEIHIEVNIGGFPINEFLWLSSDFLFKDKEIFSYNNVEINVPNIGIHWVIFLSELTTREKIDFKDIIDYYFVFKDNRVECDNILQNCSYFYLHYLFREILYKMYNNGELNYNKTKYKLQRSYKNLCYMNDINKKKRFIYYNISEFLVNKSLVYLNSHLTKSIENLLYPDYVNLYNSGFPISIYLLNDNFKSKSIKVLTKNDIAFLLTPTGLYGITNSGILYLEDIETTIKEMEDDYGLYFES